jgi:hypothetical protein
VRAAWVALAVWLWKSPIKVSKSGLRSILL